MRRGIAGLRCIASDGTTLRKLTLFNMRNVKALRYQDMNENTGRKDGSAVLGCVAASGNLVNSVHVAANKRLPDHLTMAADDS